MLASAILVLVIIFIGKAKRSGSHAQVGSEPLQFEFTASGGHRMLNKSTAAANLNFSSELVMTPLFQSSLLDSSPKFYRESEQIIGEPSQSAPDAQKALEDPFASNGEADSSTLQGKLVKGSTGKEYKEIAALDLEKSANGPIESMMRIQEIGALDSEKASQSALDAQKALEDPFASNGEVDSNPLQGKLVKGSTGKEYKEIAALDLEKSANGPIESMMRIQEIGALDSEKASQSAPDAQKVLEDPFPSNGEADSNPLQGKLVKGPFGKEYKYIKQIGVGIFGEVWSATDSPTDVEKLEPTRAIKVSKKLKSQMSDIAISSVFEEVRAMDKCAESPYVVRMLDRFQDNNGRIYIVMEFVPGGDLVDNINAWNNLSWKVYERDVLPFVFYDILRGLAYIHSQGISHRDMKCENVLITAERRAKITDFGFSGDTTTPKHENIGTDSYKAPELNAGSGYFGPEVDIFALGVILYQLVTGKKMYDPGSPPIQGTTYFPTANHTKSLKDYDIPLKMQEIIYCTQKEKIKCSPHETAAGECRCDMSDIMQMTWIQEIAALDWEKSTNRPIE